MQQQNRYHQENSPPQMHLEQPPSNAMTANANFGIQGPQANLNVSPPSFNNQHEINNQQTTSFNINGPTINSNSSNIHTGATINTGVTMNTRGNINAGGQAQNNMGAGLNVTGSSLSTPSANFNTTSSNVNLTTPSFNSNVPQASFSANLNTGTDLSASNNPSDVKRYIRKRPYSQVIAGQQITYSILLKKQQTFVLTHERFLLMKGFESIGYARQFPENQEVPFKTLEELPKQKVTVPIAEIDKCEIKDRVFTLFFQAGKKKPWEFECPTKSCATEWHKKIEAAMMHVGDYKKSGISNFQNFQLNQQQRIQQKRIEGSNQVNLMLNNPNPPPPPPPLPPVTTTTVNSEFVTPVKSDNTNFTFKQQTPPSPLSPQVNSFGVNVNYNTNEQSNNNLLFSSTNVLGHSPPQQQVQTNYFQAPQMSKIQDFIVSGPSQRVEEQQVFMTKSISQFNQHEKEGLRYEINQIKRNWIEELLGGQEQVELLSDFKTYIQKIATILISEVHIPQNEKMFPAQQFRKDYAYYLLDDVYIQIYFMPSTSGQKHPRYQQAALEFKNLDYILSVTGNEGILKVPFMVLFEYKGFLGMAKSRLPDANSAPKNRECINQFNVREFQENSRISIDSLLNEKTCTIVSYQRRTPISTTSYSKDNVYFVQRLVELLPVENERERPFSVLRGQFMQDEAFDRTLFRDPRNPVRMDKVSVLFDKKINQLIDFIQKEDEYFTNSSELEDLMHLTGLNMRHLGLMYQRCHLNWFRRILQAEMIARALKNMFRADLQNAILDQKQRSPRESHEDYQIRRVIQFLNVLFGNSGSTAALWNKVNQLCRRKFGVAVAEGNISETNVPFLMQAIQTHLKIGFNDSIHYKKYFQSPNTFDARDFLRFEFNTTIYDLNFTDLFDEIEECLSNPNLESFYNLSAILIKETSTRVPVIDMLKKHKIHERISQFLLNFTSPDESRELYSRLEADRAGPSRFLYESKLAQIKWLLKLNKTDRLQNPTVFIFEHAKKWLGTVHPLFTQVNRLLSSYFSDHPQHFQLALKYAQDSVEMQRQIFGGDSYHLWIDFFLMGKVYFNGKNTEEGMRFLLKAIEMVRVQDLNEFQTYSELTLLLCKGYFASRHYGEAYKMARELYFVIRNERDEKSLRFLLESVNWMKQVLQANQDMQTFYSFLETEFANNLKIFADYPALLIMAIRILAIPMLKNALLTKSRNSNRVLALVSDISRMTQSCKSTMAPYVRQKILEGIYPRSFLLQLKDMDTITDEISNSHMLDRWRTFYQSSSQGVLDRLGATQINRGFQFLANLTALFNLFGRQVLDQLMAPR